MPLGESKIVFSVKNKVRKLRMEHDNDIIFEYLLIPIALLLIKVLDDRLQKNFLPFS